MIQRPLTPPDPPPGFEMMEPPGVFLNRAAYFFSRDEGGGVHSVGTWITQDQCNSEDVAHGGFLLTYADFALTYILTGVTLNLSADFLRPARLGSWIETRVSARRRTRSLIFADAVATCGDVDILRMSGLFRPFEKRP